MTVKRKWAEALTGTGKDFEMDFDPEYLETQLAVADSGSLDYEHVAQVIVRQLKREVEYGDGHYEEAFRLHRKLQEIAGLVGEFVER